jgi:hypothetical protein
MRYLNFKLASPRTIELVALDLNWDLHNFAEFRGLRVTPEASAVLEWVVPDVANAWGDSKNHYRGCELWFRQVQRFEIAWQQTKIPPSENRTLAELSELEEVPLGATTALCLFMSFNGGLSVKVASAEAELRPLERTRSSR